ncbi:DegT/DnrJ/EryC1/StrS family aminotransferase [uncultured Thalassospira sp.]|uniref:DegT/DnrJ/EryC1/StrS family aminotransferase n=1 Tax=uncultured Thalassospira sp. TaxID=404382 RepID=UPI0025864D29|nr:DegT/DnrJ/EryC1/StrS family aminotransferase [uncultured Thalassospira sp.]
MIPLAVPNLSGNEAAYLQDCVESTFVSTVGPYVTRFEQEVASAAGTRYAVATSSGTTALHMGLLAMGVGRDDVVILPSMTFIASANAISHCGASPWLMDVDQRSWTLCPQVLEAELFAKAERRHDGVFLKECGRQVKAILPVFNLGMAADMDALGSIAEEWALPLIVDAAAALGAEYKGKMSGACGAIASMYSFNGNKTVTAGGGGILATDDEALAKMVRHLSTTARASSDYDHDMVGYNHRMTNLQAAVGCAQMEQLPMFLQRKRQVRARYDSAFTEKGLKPFPRPQWTYSADWYSGFVYPFEDVTDFRNRLRKKGVDARPFWKPVHLQLPYQNAVRSEMPVCGQLWDRIVTLPCSTHISDSELEKVVNSVLEAL